MDLFDTFNMPEFTEFPVLPKELQGLDLEPDKLDPINVKSELPCHYIRIEYGPGEAKLLNEMVGYPFIKEGKVSYKFSELLDKAQPVSDSESKNPGYVLVRFEPEETEKVLEVFHLPYYRKNDMYKVGDLYGHEYLKFE